jgi:hypothetical protein
VSRDLVALASLGGAAVGAGALVLVRFALGAPPREPGDDATAPSSARFRRGARVAGTPAGTGAAAAILTLVASGRVVLAAAVGLLTASSWHLSGGASEQRAALVRLDALVSWTQSLRDAIRDEVGLEQAIPATVAAAAPALRPALEVLVDGLRIRDPDALARFADQVDDPSADLIIGSLLLNARLRGPALRTMLTALGVTAREELDLRRRIDTSSRADRRVGLVVVGVTLSVAAPVMALNQRYLATYGTTAGEWVLLAVVALFGVGAVSARRRARVELPARFLAGASGRELGLAGWAGSAGSAGWAGSSVGAPRPAVPAGGRFP